MMTARCSSRGLARRVVVVVALTVRRAKDDGGAPRRSPNATAAAGAAAAGRASARPRRFTLEHCRAPCFIASCVRRPSGSALDRDAWSRAATRGTVASLTRGLASAATFDSAAAAAATTAGPAEASAAATWSDAAANLLDGALHPPGSYTADTFAAAQRALDECLTATTTAATTKGDAVAEVNLSLRLLERLLREVAAAAAVVDSEPLDPHDHLQYIGEARYLPAVVKQWRDAAYRRGFAGRKARNSAVDRPPLGEPNPGEVLPSARALLPTLQNLAALLPALRPEIAAAVATLVLPVLIKEVPPSEAPLAAEPVLQWLEAPTAGAVAPAAARHTSAVAYQLVMTAWADSPLPVAADRMEVLLQRMRQCGVSPTVATYNLLLKTWVRLGGGAAKTEEIVSIMRQEGLEPTLETLSQVLQCCCRADRIDPAETVLRRMMVVAARGGETSAPGGATPRPHHHRRASANLVVQSACLVMNMYRRVAAPGALRDEQRIYLRRRIQAFARQMKRSGLFTAEAWDRLSGIQMDIYAREGNLKGAQTLFAQMEAPDSAKYRLMIKAYGNCDRADLATEVFQTMVDDDSVEPTLEVYNTLINAWAESTRPESAEQAFAVLRRMEQDEICAKLGIRPDVVTYNTLFKCLAASKNSDACIKAEAVLKEMEGRFLAGATSVKPNAISYNLCIKACLQAGASERIDAVLERMKVSDSPPNLRTYNEILNHCSRQGTRESAERAEEILADLNEMSRASPSMKPDIYSYTLVLKACATSGEANALNKTWKIYQQMRSATIEPDFVVYATLISVFAKSPDSVQVNRAASLLKYMENSSHEGSRPETQHYMAVVRGLINIGHVENATAVLTGFADAYASGQTGRDRPLPPAIHAVAMAWLEAGDLVRATLFVEHMQALHGAQRLPRGPDLTTYVRLVAEWAKSGHPSKEVYETKIIAQIEALGGDRDLVALMRKIAKRSSDREPGYTRHPN